MIAALLLARLALAGNVPTFPTLTFSSTLTASTSSISVSPYADSEYMTASGQLSGSVWHSHGALKEWSLSVVAIGGTAPYWVVDLEVSNDDATWTRLLRHEKTPATPSGTMVWGAHHKARRARLTLKAVSRSPTITATAYAEPGGCP